MKPTNQMIDKASGVVVFVVDLPGDILTKRASVCHHSFCIQMNKTEAALVWSMWERLIREPQVGLGSPRMISLCQVSLLCGLHKQVFFRVSYSLSQLV